MPDQFTYDVLLSHSAKDKVVVRELAERLRVDGLKVWFDEWELPVAASRQSAASPSGEQTQEEKVGGALPRRRYEELIEEGLEHSRVLVLCMSANAFGSDWAQLESATLRTGQRPFRDPLNKERRFLPQRLDDAPIKGSLAQFLYINWRPENSLHRLTRRR